MKRRHLRTQDRVILFHFLCKGNLFDGGRSNRTCLMLFFLGTKSSQKGTDTDAGSPQVIYLIDFQAGVDFAASLQNFVYFIRGYGIQTAAKGGSDPDLPGFLRSLRLRKDGNDTSTGRLHE